MPRSKPNRQTAAYLASVARSAGVPAFLLEDAMQEMRVRLWKANTPPDDTTSGLIAKRAAVDFLRRMGRKRGRQAADVIAFADLDAGAGHAANEPATDQAPDGLEEFANMSYVGVGAGGADLDVQLEIVELRIALRQLPEQQREIIALYALYGLPVAEIGACLRPPLEKNDVRKQLTQALARVRELAGRPFDLGVQAAEP